MPKSKFSVSDIMTNARNERIKEADRKEAGHRSDLAAEVRLREQTQLTLTVMQKALGDEKIAHAQSVKDLKDSNDKVAKLELALSQHKADSTTNSQLMSELASEKRRGDALEVQVSLKSKPPDDQRVKSLEAALSASDALSETRLNENKSLSGRLDRFEKKLASLGKPSTVKPPTFTMEVTGRDSNSRVKTVRLKPVKE